MDPKPDVTGGNSHIAQVRVPQVTPTDGVIQGTTASSNPFQACSRRTMMQEIGQYNREFTALQRLTVGLSVPPGCRLRVLGEVRQYHTEASAGARVLKREQIELYGDN
jgi:hypothetical protein